jgi:hypothetical protein
VTKRFNLLVSAFVVLVAMLIGAVAHEALQPVGAEAAQMQPTGWQMACNGIVVCIPDYTPTPIVSSITNTPSRTPTRTLTPTASTTPTKEPTPTLVTLVASPLPTGTVLACDGYPCFNGENEWLVQVTSPVWMCKQESMPFVGCGNVPARQVRLRTVGEKFTALCAVEFSAGGNLFLSEEKCSSADPTWTPFRYLSKQYLNLLSLK